MTVRIALALTASLLLTASCVHEEAEAPSEVAATSSAGSSPKGLMEGCHALLSQFVDTATAGEEAQMAEGPPGSYFVARLMDKPNQRFRAFYVISSLDILVTLSAHGLPIEGQCFLDNGSLAWWGQSHGTVKAGVGDPGGESGPDGRGAGEGEVI